MFSDVLVVCVGNICRSPMAEAILLKRLGSLPISVSSAGLQAMTGAPMADLAQEVLRDNGLTLASHRARQVDRQMLRRASLILSMEQSHLASLYRRAPEIRGKTFLIGHWQHPPEIVDPWRKPKAAFEHTYAHLWRCVDDWLPYLQSGDPK